MSSAGRQPDDPPQSQPSGPPQSQPDDPPQSQPGSLPRRRWPILEHHSVTSHDIADGCLTAEALDAWTLSVREDYLARNHALRALLGRGLHLEYSTSGAPAAASTCLALGTPERVAVSAGVTAVADDAFTLTVRVHALDGPVELAIDVPTDVRVADDAGAVQELPMGVREAIAALEADAPHLN